MKRWVPWLLTFGAGTMMMADFFVPHRAFANAARPTPAATSSALGTIGLRGNSRPRGRPRQVHTGWRGGHTQLLAQSRNACFTRRSPPE